MRTELLGKFAGLAGIACLALMVAGCEDDEDEPGTQAPTNEAGTSVTLTATMTGAPSATATNTVNLKTGNANELLEVASGAKVTIKQPGAPDVDATTKFKFDPKNPTTASVEGLTIDKVGVYHVIINGANGAVVLKNNGKVPNTVRLGTVDIGFERLSDGTIVVPTSATVTIPTKGSTLAKGATFNGLKPGNKVVASLTPNTGTKITKQGVVAAGDNKVIITDVAGGIDASSINGNASSLTMLSTAK